MELDPQTDLELVRELKAPKALLWQCWTDARHFPHWFVPKPHKVAACSLDLRVGGACNTTFDVDGTLMENNGVYLEVIPGEKLVFTDTYTAGWKPAADPFMTAIVTFEDLGGGVTRYRAIARHRNPEAAESHRKMGFYDGWGTVAGQLEGYAQELETRTMVITRHIKAPVAKVMQCWTDPAILPKWFGPAGYSCTTKAIDLREGGEWTFDMEGEGKVWPNRHRFKVLREGRIEFVLDAGVDDGSGKEVAVTMAEKEGGTLVTFVMTFANAAEREGAKGYGAEEKGAETLGKLAAMAEG